VSDEALEEKGEGLARAGLTLVAVKAALQKWQGHMRRGASLASEDEFAAALALVPYTPNPPAYQARTLRALADLCASQGRLDEAVALFGRVAEGSGGRLSAQFWRDYATLCFRLALKRVGAGQVALANQALSQAAELLQGPADQPEVWAAAFDGYAETALWFERAGEPVPAALYAERALDYGLRLGRPEAVGSWLRRLAQTGVAKAGAGRGLVWLDRLQSLRLQGWPQALGYAVQAAVSLAQAELALGRGAGGVRIFEAAQGWLRAAGGDSPALADLELGWGLALGPAEGRPHLELALSLRRRLLGPQHPRTREAEQALGGLAAEPVVDGASPGPRAWDGGAQFQAASGAGEAASAELKRLHRRLARLCHPDGAAMDEAAWRHELMVRVNQAADAGDLFSLRALFREALARHADALKPIL
jgi:tetratricopeptide (TPR) repeat protein